MKVKEGRKKRVAMKKRERIKKKEKEAFVSSLLLNCEFLCNDARN